MNMLVCVAEMPGGERQLHLGKLVADAMQAEVTLLHVLTGDAPDANGEAVLAAAGEELGDTRHTTRLERGAPVRVILQVAREGNHDLIVVGARQAPAAVEQPIGRVARQVATDAPVSTLVVKGQRASLERLLVCSGGRPIAEPVIKLGAQLAQATNARATLLHVSSAVPSMYTGLDAMEESLGEFLRRDTPEAQHLRHGAELFAQYDVEAVLELRHGVAISEIMRSVQLQDYDLIMVGAPDAAGRLNRLLVGEVTLKILDLAPCPVLVARPGPAE